MGIVMFNGIFLFVASILLWAPMVVSDTTQKFDFPIGSQAPPWDVDDWINSTPLHLEDLKGKVILVRWWTAPHCPYCRNSAPALNEFYERYHHQGLEVIGFYHHKSLGPLDKEKVKQYTQDFRFKFPIAIDHDWKTLKDWWLEGNPRGWTSVSFLIDRLGVIRYIHPGGEYVKGDEDHLALKTMIEKLLEEPIK